jgi:hypothetical protein
MTVCEGKFAYVRVVDVGVFDCNTVPVDHIAYFAWLEEVDSLTHYVAI